MLCCRDNTFYTGIAKDLQKRINAHNNGKDGAKYTRTRRPVHLIYLERYSSRSAAAKREHQLKKMPRSAKEKLIEENSDCYSAQLFMPRTAT